MKSIGFTQTSADPCIYVHVNSEGEPDCYVGVYVDDIVIVPCDDEMARWVKGKLQEEFRVTDMGLLDWYLGMKITQVENEITVSQSLYTENILKKFNMFDSNPSQTPMISGEEQTNDPDQGKADQAVYRSAIGCLMYLSVCTRPDISLAVQKLARAVSDPRISDWVAVKKVFRYLCGTQRFGLCMKAEPSDKICGYVDASWGERPR
jgi:hypothetical protein